MKSLLIPAIAIFLFTVCPMSFADSSSQCLIADIAGQSSGPGDWHDGKVNLQDFAVIASAWLNPSCDQSNQWCDGADLNTDYTVNNADLFLFADCWLNEDNQAPTPDPAQWAIDGEPASWTISSFVILIMTAEPVTDNWFGSDVEYFFECTQTMPYEEDPSIHSSGWQASNTYLTTPLTGRSEYFFRVFARDPVGNITLPSVTLSVIAGADTTPPLPTKSAWLVPPTSTRTTINQPLGITMSAVEAVDPEGNQVEYFFKCTSHPSFDSNWRSDPNYNVPDDTPAWNLTESLAEGQIYTFTVLARDRSENNNACEPSDPESVALSEFVDTNPPLPLKTAWETPPESTGTVANNTLGITMSAQQAIDPESSGVEYYFACTSHTGFDSGWIDSRQYNLPDDNPSAPAPDLFEDTTYTFTVQARDKSPQQNACDVSDPAAVFVNIFLDTTPPDPNPIAIIAIGFYPDIDGITHHFITAEVAASDSGSDIQYEFDATADDDAQPSGWIDTEVYDYAYGSDFNSALYRVRAREVIRHPDTGAVLWYNVGSWSPWVQAY